MSRDNKLSKLIYKSIKFKLYLGVFFLLFILLGIGHYFFIVTLSIYILLITSFSKAVSHKKLDFLMKLLFILFFWIIISNILNILCLSDALALSSSYFFKAQDSIYVFLILFLNNYIEVENPFIYKINIDSMIGKIKALGLPKYTILDKNKSPKDPDPETILALLGADEDKEKENLPYYTIRNIAYPPKNGEMLDLSKFKGLFTPRCLISKDPEDILKGDYEKYILCVSSKEVKIQNVIYKISTLNEKLNEYNLKNKPLSLSKIFIPEGAGIKNGKFPDIYRYININSNPDYSFDKILPRHFYLNHHIFLWAYNLQFNTLLVVQDVLNNKLQDDMQALKLTNWWVNYQVKYYLNDNHKIISILKNEAIKPKPWEDYNHVLNSPVFNPLKTKEDLLSEIREDIVYLGKRMLESAWTIKYLKEEFGIKNLIDLSDKNKDEIINFYNNLYKELKKNVYNKNKLEYESYKKISYERISNHGRLVGSWGYYIDIPLNKETYKLPLLSSNIRDPIIKTVEHVWRDELAEKQQEKLKKFYTACSKIKIKVKKPKVKFIVPIKKK